ALRADGLLRAASPAGVEPAAHDAEPRPFVARRAPDRARPALGRRLARGAAGDRRQAARHRGHEPRELHGDAHRRDGAASGAGGVGRGGRGLGSFGGPLTAEMEPRLGRVANLLGGGGLVDGFYDHPQGALVRKAYEALGGTREKLQKILAPYDPLTCAANLK